MFVVGSLVVAVSLVAGASSPSSDLVGTNGTFVDTPPRYRYLYPCTTSISVLLFVPNFFCSLPVGDDVFVLSLPFQGLVFLVSTYPTCQDQRYFTLVEDSGDFFQTSYVARLRDDPYCPPPPLAPLTCLLPLRPGHPEKLPFIGAVLRCLTRALGTLAFQCHRLRPWRLLRGHPHHLMHRCHHQ